jgi:hypothetical protein
VGTHLAARAPLAAGNFGDAGFRFVRVEGTGPVSLFKPTEIFLRVHTHVP